jgi:hypothetical protein
MTVVLSDHLDAGNHLQYKQEDIDGIFFHQQGAVGVAESIEHSLRPPSTERSPPTPRLSSDLLLIIPTAVKPSNLKLLHLAPQVLYLSSKIR